MSGAAVTGAGGSNVKANSLVAAGGARFEFDPNTGRKKIISAAVQMAGTKAAGVPRGRDTAPLKQRGKQSAVSPSRTPQSVTVTPR